MILKKKRLILLIVFSVFLMLSGIPNIGASAVHADDSVSTNFNSLDAQLREGFFQYYYTKDQDLRNQKQLNRSVRSARRYNRHLRSVYRQIIRNRHNKLHILSPKQTSQNDNNDSNGTVGESSDTVNQTNHYYNYKWFRDGLSRNELNAREWISQRESSDRWNAINPKSSTIGYFQLLPQYLGYHRNGSVNLGHRHQVKTADQYVANRYGDWLHAQAFWQNNNWY